MTQTIGGITYADPYVWLEDETSAVHDWQQAQTRMAVEKICSWPGFVRVREAISEAMVDTGTVASGGGPARTAPVRHGHLWFQSRLVNAGDQFASVVASEAPAGSGRVILDPGAWTRERGVPVGLDFVYPSPQGSYVAYGVSEGGSEQSVLRVREVSGGHDLAIEIQHTSHTSLAWLPDESGFFYTAFAAAEAVTGERKLFLRRLEDSGPARPLEIPGLTQPVAGVQVSADGTYAVLIASHRRPGPRFYCELGLEPMDWLPVELPADMVLVGEVVGERYVGVTTDSAPRGRVISVPLAHAGDRSSWSELIPQGPEVLRAITLSDGRLLAYRYAPGRQLITTHRVDGGLEAELLLPPGGCLGLGVRSFIPYGTHHGDQFIFVHSTPGSSPCTYQLNLATLTLNRLTEPERRRRDGELGTRQLTATSADGTELTYTLIHRADLDTSTPHPVLLMVYGGFDGVLVPTYMPMVEPFIDAGGIYVLANLRGGGEQGEPWWLAGRRANKQNTFDDLYATAEHLVASGVTTRDRLVVIGSSNGGLTAAVAVSQRPDLWGAVVCLVPLTDLMRIKRDSFTSYIVANELGDPEIDEEAAWLYAYSPCQQVRPGVAYPATLISAGEHDLRCPPWHARKLAAHLQAATAGVAPILLRVQPQTGHGPGTAADAEVQAGAETIAFVMAAVGLEPREVDPRSH